MNKKYLALVTIITTLGILTISQTWALWPFGKDEADEKQTAEIVVNEEPLKRDAKLTSSFSGVVKEVSPSVVSIYTKKIINQRSNPMMSDPFFRFFFGVPGQSPDGPQQREFKQEVPGLGSGVIVSKDGYILTNNHVIEDVDEIMIHLQDGTEREFQAEVVGTDPPTDIAVLKIKDEDLPTATLGNSNNVEVGDLVLAIGNPFNVGQTVTMGIVSAKGRKSQLSASTGVQYQDFIQTDASINPGNSGGALIDAEGRVVGINTAIFSRTGGNLGIGFAVPVNLARDVMQQIIETGHVSRGYLGVYMDPNPLDKSNAELFGIPGKRGVIVTEVIPDSPADKADFQSGDVITEFNGVKVADNSELSLEVAKVRPGTAVDVKIYRQGKEQMKKVTLDERGDLKKEETSDPEEKETNKPGKFLDGVEIQELDSSLRQQYAIPENITGVFVSTVAPSSSAYQADLRPGNIIRAVNNVDVNSIADARNAAKESKKDKTLLFVWQKTNSDRGITRYLVIKKE
ncbi:MAG: Do family serine endopeptidase [Verrucomicrobiota bacterium]